MNLTNAARELHELAAALKEHEEKAMAETARIKGEIAKRKAILNMAGDGIDPEKVALARTILFVRGEYDRAGDDRVSVISDAIKHFATGDGDMWRIAFGTKSYDRWHGQRTDCEYGYGPGHGSIIFQIGVLDDVRKSRKQDELTTDEVEAVIYFLTNLPRIQAAERNARAAYLSRPAQDISSGTKATGGDAK